MKTIFSLTVLSLALAGNVSAQVTGAVDFTQFRFNVTNNPDASHVRRVEFRAGTNRVPLILFTDLPITSAIENLARQADLNYLLQPGLFTGDNGQPLVEPQLSIRWEGITARDALIRICTEHDLKLVENSTTHIARITRVSEPKGVLNASLLSLHTNQAAATPDRVIPLIQFSDVPLDLAFMNLIKQSGRSIELASNLMEQVSQHIDTNGVVTFREKIFFKESPHDSWFNTMPHVSIRWENVTSEQAIVALCENYDLDLVTNAVTGNLQITPRKITRHHRLRHY